MIKSKKFYKAMNLMRQFSRMLGILLLAGLITQITPVFAQAFDQNDLNSIINETPFYDSGETASPTPCANSTSAALNGTDTSGQWTSNLNPPYYLEEFAIQVLEDVASKMGVAQSQAVTQEHVVALVAWFWEEGGDIDDGPPNQAVNPYPDLFNPLNTSINDPSIEQTYGPAGVESFLSFDDGVEGTARTIVGSLQNRIADALTNPSTTAEQVMDAIANYQDYSGNQAWAWGPNPSDPTAVETFNQTVYLPALLQSVSQLRANYVSEASTEMGTPDAEAFIPADKVPASDLQYSGGTSNPPGDYTSSSGCNGGTGSGTVNCSSNTATADLSQIRQKVVCIAEQQYSLWSSGQVTPAQGLFTYTQGNSEEWCADFVSWVYMEAGDPFLTPNWRISAVTVGTPNIQSLPQENPTFQIHSSPYVPQPGDLAIIPAQHVELVISVNSAGITQIGGDEGSVADDPAGYGGDPNANPPVPNESQVLESQVSGYYGMGITYYVSPD
jgi:uncharacterized protein YbdZ (MbtH family)